MPAKSGVSLKTGPLLVTTVGVLDAETGKGAIAPPASDRLISAIWTK
jgi:hypothetical protein